MNGLNKSQANLSNSIIAAEFPICWLKVFNSASYPVELGKRRHNNCRLFIQPLSVIQSLANAVTELGGAASIFT